MPLVRLAFLAVARERLSLATTVAVAAGPPALNRTRLPEQRVL